MTLRDALVALSNDYDDNKLRAEAFVQAVRALLSAHPAVGGDAVTVACEAYEDARWSGRPEIRNQSDAAKHRNAIRAALDAAWPGMVADAGRLDWLAREWAKNGAVSFDRYHPPGTEGCRLFTCTTQHVRGLGFRKTLDAAIAISIGPIETFDAMEASRDG